MKIYTNFEQKSDEWLRIRSGKLTASNAQAIATGGKGLQTLCLETVAEYYSSAVKEQIENEHIQRGNELEAEARTVYEMETGNRVIEIGFVELNEYVGCSPDGIIDGQKVGVEIKCPSDRVYLDVLLNKTIDPKYFAQMQMQMFVCEWEACDYTVYNPNFEQSIVIQRVYPDEDYRKKLTAGIEKGTEIIKDLHEKMRKINEHRGLQRRAS